MGMESEAGFGTQSPALNAVTALGAFINRQGIIVPVGKRIRLGEDKGVRLDVLRSSKLTRKGAKGNW